MGCSFFVVPNALNYLGNYSYGVWITFFNMILWIGNFDLGIGNGFRNELTRAYSRKDKQYIKQIVSSGIVSFLIISIVMIIIGLTINNILFYNYYSSIYNPNELFYAMLILIIGYSLDIILKTTGIIFTANQSAGMVPFISALTSILSLGSVLFLRHYNYVCFDSKIITYSIFVGIIPIISNIIVTIYAFCTKFIDFVPSYKYYNKDIVKLTSKAGWKFFLIQICMILSLQLYNIFITTWSTANNVTVVSVADKYFGLLSVLGTVVLFPFWSRFTKADEDNDYRWIKLTLYKLEKYFIGFILMSICMLLSFDLFKSIWLGEAVKVPQVVSVLVMFKYLGLVYSSIYCYYLNGIGKLKEQLLLYGLMAVLNYPSSFLLFKLFGFEGILIFPVISFFIMGIILRAVVHNDVSMKISKSSIL